MKNKIIDDTTNLEICGIRSGSLNIIDDEDESKDDNDISNRCHCGDTRNLFPFIYYLFLSFGPQKRQNLCHATLRLAAEAHRGIEIN